MNSRDYLIIGSGPAGLQMGYFMEKAGMDYVILEGGPDASCFFEDYPRHRTLLSINKVYTGLDDEELNFRWDWNSFLCDSPDMLFKQFTKEYFPGADALVDYHRAFARHYNLNITYNSPVTNVAKEADGSFSVTAGEQIFHCRYLLDATGVKKPRSLDIKGIEHAECYSTMSVDQQDFINQRVLIIGKGNSAFETADHLTPVTAYTHMLSPNPLKLAWKSHHVGHLRAVNNNFLDTYLLKSQNSLLDAHIQEIRPNEDGSLTVDLDFTRAHGATESFTYDRVLSCTGFSFDADHFDESSQPQMHLDDRFPEMTAEWESVNVPGLYFIGTVMQSRDFKKTQSSFIHGFRYNIRALFNLLRHKNHELDLPTESFPLEAEAVAEGVLQRITRFPTLWHQPGFLCSVVVLDQENDRMVYHPELPVDYVTDTELWPVDDYFMFTLEYGPDYPDYPFEFNRFTDPAKAHLNPQLHPIVRHYSGGKVVAEHHVLEEMDGFWNGEQFTQPLIKFLRERMAMTLETV